MYTPRNRMAAFTLIELMIVVAIVAVIITLAAPSFRDYILMQRLRAINAQLVTDLAFARSEAVSRGTFMQVSFRPSCYIIYARTDSNATNECDCTAAATLRCTSAQTTEVKTVQVPASDLIVFEPTGSPAGTQVPRFTVIPRNGGIKVDPMAEMSIPDRFTVYTKIDATRQFRTEVLLSGRVGTCAPSGSTVGGPAC